MYVTINEDQHGLFEIFNTIGKAGGCAASQSEAIGRMVSLAWRSGIPAEETIKQLIGIRCHKPVGFGDNQITSCADALAKAILMHLGNDKHDYRDHHQTHGGGCPECGGTLEPKEGCATCEGCGYCEKVCPTHAITMKERFSGYVYFSKIKGNGSMVHARLDIGAENSGKLVAKVKNEAKSLAELQNKTFVIVDGSPGIGCPVVSSLSGANYVVLVTEPTVSGLHDLERVYSVIKRFRI